MSTTTTKAAVPKRVGRAPGVCKPTKYDNVLAGSAPPPESTTAPKRQGQRYAGDKSYLGTRDNIEAKVVCKPHHFNNFQRKKTPEQIPDTHVYADPMNPNIFAGAPSGHVPPRGRRTYIPESHDVLPSKKSIAAGPPPPTEAPHYGKKIIAAKNTETGNVDLPPRGAPPAHRTKKSESKGMSAILGKGVDGEHSSSNQHSHPSNTPLGNRRVRRPPAGADAGAAGRPSAVNGTEVKLGGGKSVSSKVAMERQHGTLSQERSRGGEAAAVVEAPFTATDVAGVASTAAAAACNRPHRRPVETKGNMAAELQQKSATSSLNGILRVEEGRFKKRDYSYAPPWGTVGTASSVAPPKSTGPTDTRPSWQKTPRGPKITSGSERKHIHVSVSQAVRTPWASE